MSVMGASESDPSPEMQVAVFDTCVRGPDGRTMLFDILVPNGVDHATAVAYGRAYLTGKGVSHATLQAQECRFCHLEQASEAVERDIRNAGFSILELENCD